MQESILLLHCAFTLPYSRAITYGALSNYSRVHCPTPEPLFNYTLIPERLHTYLLEITYVFPSDYSRIPFYLYTEPILFTPGVPSIYIRTLIVFLTEKLNYHHDEKLVSS